MFPPSNLKQRIKYSIETHLARKTVLSIQPEQKLKQFEVAARNQVIESFDVGVFTQKLIAYFGEC